MSTKIGSTALELANKPDEMQAWLEWEATPPEERDPPSLAKLAAHLGITENTLYAWRRDPRHGRARQSALALQIQGYLPKIAARMAEIALTGRPREATPAANLLFKIVVDDRQDKDKVSESFGGDPTVMTTNQLRDVADALSSAADEVDAQSPAAIDV